MATREHSESVEGTLEERLSVAGIDPTLILTVVETVLGLLSKCTNKSAAKAGMANPTRLETVLVRRALQAELRDHGQIVSRSELDRITKAVLDASASAPQDERDDLLNYCTEYTTI